MVLSSLKVAYATCLGRDGFDVIPASLQCCLVQEDNCRGKNIEQDAKGEEPQ